MILNKEQIAALQLKYLGKKIKLPDTNKYTGFTRDRSDVSGICQSIGYNLFIPSWGLVVVIDRMPITNVDHTKIELVSQK